MLTDRATVLNFCDHVAQATSVLTDLNTSLLDYSSREDITEVLLYAMKSLSDAYTMAIASPYDLLKVPDSVVISSLQVQCRQMQEAYRRVADELDLARRQYTSTFDSLQGARDLIARLRAKVAQLEALDEPARVKAARDRMVASLQHERKANLSLITSLRERVRKYQKLTKHLIGELARRDIPLNIPQDLTFDS